MTMTPIQLCTALERFGIKASPDRSRIRISIKESRKLINMLTERDMLLSEHGVAKREGEP